MSALTNVSINGVSTLAQYEYTSGQVKQQYYDHLLPFIKLLNLQQQGSTPVAEQVTQQNLADVQAAIAGFQQLAQNGLSIPDPSDPTKQIKSYMTVSQAHDLDLLLRSIRATGVSPDFSNLDLSHLQLWRDIAVQSPNILNTVQSAQADTLTATRTLQSLVELEYVATGNEIISNSMKSLDAALNLTQGVLNTLADLQNLHNEIQVTGKVPFSSVFNFGQALGPTAYQTAYNSAASAYFGKPITPQLLSGLGDSQIPGPHFRSAMNELIRIRDAIRQELVSLSAQGPAASITSPDSLFGKLKAVYNDINTKFTVSGTQIPVSANTPLTQAFSGFSAWLIDNYSSFSSPNATLSGQIQQNITFAISAGESLNDSQKQSVRRYLFVFQEYYQSASQVLTQINQLLTQMAQNIAR